MNLLHIINVNLLHVIIVLAVLLVVTVAVGLIMTYSQIDRNLADNSEDYIWKGRLPTVVFDYTEPRYVYENLVESTKYLPENGHIIGYRISPELVIHSRIFNSVCIGLSKDRIKKVGGKLMNNKEVEILLDNWEQVSILRQKAGESPLCCNKLLLGTQGRGLVVFEIECLSSPKTHLGMSGIRTNPHFHDIVSLFLKR